MVRNLEMTSGATTRSRKGLILAPKDISHTRVGQLIPRVWEEIQDNFSDAEYFTRDHLLYFRCMRQFSMSYRISLVRITVNHLVATQRLIKFNLTDLAINNPANLKRHRELVRDVEVVYSGSYTTRAADELLINELPVKHFDRKWLASWLTCLQHLADSTKTYYTKRIIDDLLRRGVLKEHPGQTYTVNYI